MYQIVLNCTNRKHLVPRRGLQLRTLRQKAHGRAAAWIERVAVAPQELEAASLYSGDYWHGGQQLLKAGSHPEPRLWILSAGYGLLAADDRVASYGATLSDGHPDSVARRDDPGPPGAVRRHWWRSLAEWEGPPGANHPRTLEGVAAGAPDVALIVCVGPTYLEAAADDLLRSTQVLDAPSMLVIFGSGRCRVAALEPSFVPIEGKLRLALGGAMGSLTVRAAAHVIERLGADTPSVGAARAAIGSLARNALELPSYDRKKLSDDEIANWIENEFATSPGLAKSPALRRLRDAGFACEQSRFGGLFDDVAATLP